MPPENLPVGPIFPRKPGPFIRAGADGGCQVVVGQWGLIPWFAKGLPLKYSTNNARIETAPTAATFKLPWTRGQRCLIVAESFDEPNWESGKNEWWRFRRADGRAWGLAGLWNTWTDKTTGEIVESYTMLTMNADAHPLMRRMHKPEPKLAPHEPGQTLGDRDQPGRLGYLAAQPAWIDSRGVGVFVYTAKTSAEVCKATGPEHLSGPEREGFSDMLVLQLGRNHAGWPQSKAMAWLNSHRVGHEAD